MDRPLHTRSRNPGTLVVAIVALVAIVAASTWTGLANGWVQDDLPIIFTNEAVHSLARPWSFFLTAYWPDPFPRELYRPLTVLLLAMEWAIGDGRPVVFRIASILIYLGTTFMVWRLGRRLLPAWPAFVAAALFAAHPVHVEAVAVAVNQAELLVALLLSGCVVAWIDRRRAGLSVSGHWGLGLGAVYFVATLVKEHALVLPALIVAAEFTVLATPGVARLDRAAWRRVGIIAAFVVALVIAIRDQVLSGNTRGTFTAEALVDQGIGGRLLTMLGVVPEWVRLLIWPAHLQADYSPQEIVPATAFGQPQLLGVLLLAVAIALFVSCRRRLPVVAFGVAWVAIALGPVHNVLVPTGIVMAERTLFLASMGFVIGGVALLDAGRQAVADKWRGAVGLAATIGVAALLVMGITRSASRYRVWHDLATLWRQTLIDAPRSYRAHHAYAQVLFTAGAKGLAEQHYRRAMELYPVAWPVYLDLADKYRLAAECWPAIDLYQMVLRLNPYHAAGRGSLVACLLYVGEYSEAGKVARQGVELELEAANFERYAAVADSAAAVRAPANSVRLPPPVLADSTRP